MSKAPDCGSRMRREYPELSEDLPLWMIMAAMSKEQMKELRELTEEARKEGWDAAVEQIAEGLELETDNRAARAARIRQLKDLVPASLQPQKTRGAR